MARKRIDNRTFALDIQADQNEMQIRCLRGFAVQTFSARAHPISKAGPAALFQPMITSSSNPVLDCDFNMHKSNSTYFADFDVARLNLLIRLVGAGMIKTKVQTDKGEKIGVSIMLGGVSCNFRREIKPHESFEMWSRVLCWDRKWIYVVTHFVKKGTVKPTSYTLQPWKKIKARKSQNRAALGSNGHAINGASAKVTTHPAIFATGIAKYVFKQGRLTVNPELVLQSSGLLPPKPRENEVSPATARTPAEGINADAAPTSDPQGMTLSEAEQKLDASMGSSAGDGDWDWDRVEQERVKGMDHASLFNGLEALNDEFSPEGKPALGQYGEWF